MALRLGNPILVAQCKVFAAFSFIQGGQLKLAAKIVRYITKNCGLCMGIYAENGAMLLVGVW